MQDTLRITEVFYSLQGETRTAGLPTVFVRLTGCPLRCGYCDSAYAFSGGTVRPLDDILEQVASFRPRYVCVTGGEPLAQPNAIPLLKQLCTLRVYAPAAQFFNDTATTEIYTLSLHDALPISRFTL